MITVNSDRTDTFIDALTALWEASIRATHHFLTEDDIQKLIPVVKMGLSGIETLVVAEDNQKPVAFMGIEAGKIEMLFVSPDHFGKGIGRELAELGISQYGVQYVDVNEQNPQAAGFYRHVGFEVFERTELDEQGNPFPILKMKQCRPKAVIWHPPYRDGYADHPLVIETERLLLRQLEVSDFDNLCTILQDDEVMYAYEGAFDKEQVQQWLDRQLTRYQEDGIGLYAVILKESGEFIGQCGLTMQDYKETKVMEIGYLFRKAFWHKGYATEAAIACRAYAFNTLNVDELFSIIRDTNIASQKVAIRNGMVSFDKFVKYYRGVDMPHLVFSVKRK